MKLIITVNALILIAALAAGMVLHVLSGRHFKRDVIFIAPMLNESRFYFSADDLDNLRVAFPGYTIVSESRGTADSAAVFYTGDFYFGLHHMDFLHGGQGFVINEALAWQRFGNTDAVGLFMEVDNRFFQVSGVVRQGRVRADSANLIWMPHADAAGSPPVTALYVHVHDYNVLDASVDTRTMIGRHLYRNPVDYAIVDINLYTESIAARNRILLCMVWVCALAAAAAFVYKYFKGKRWVYLGICTGIFLLLCFFIIVNVNDILLMLNELSVTNTGMLPPEVYLSYGMRRLSELNRYANYAWIAGSAALFNIVLGGAKWVLKRD
ncbi:MAG: ABC transporter permease [Defluviitaleaceae bacterium]|nr:ABC transporter permease [Defluviitaleaceae bacterium]